MCCFQYVVSQPAAPVTSPHAPVRTIACLLTDDFRPFSPSPLALPPPQIVSRDTKFEVLPSRSPDSLRNLHTRASNRRKVPAFAAHNPQPAPASASAPANAWQPGPGVSAFSNQPITSLVMPNPGIQPEPRPSRLLVNAQNLGGAVNRFHHPVPQ